VSSPSFTKDGSTIPALMLEGSTSLGAPQGMTSGAAQEKGSGETVTLLPVLCSQFGAEEKAS